MKKITFIVAALLGVASFAQVQFTANPGEGVSVPNSNSLADCSKMETSADVTNGFGNTAGNEVADNFVVAQNEIFTINRTTVRLITTAGNVYPSVTVRFYEGAGTFPNTRVLVERVIVPTSQDVVATLNGGALEALEVVLDFATPVVINGVSTGPSNFWISVFTPTTAAASNFLQTLDETADTTRAAFRSGTDATAAWANTFNGGMTLQFAAYFIMEGDCSTLGVDENKLSQISVYPNPVTDVLKIKTPSSVEITSASIYDVLGKNTSVKVLNNEINVSGLSRGIYILNLETSAGKLTRKIVKQ